jgi:superfamily II DNA/RNA helicase
MRIDDDVYEGMSATFVEEDKKEKTYLRVVVKYKKATDKRNEIDVERLEEEIRFEEATHEKTKSENENCFSQCMETISRLEKSLIVRQAEIHTLTKTNEELQETVENFGIWEGHANDKHQVLKYDHTPSLF